MEPPALPGADEAPGPRATTLSFLGPSLSLTPRGLALCPAWWPRGRWRCNRGSHPWRLPAVLPTLWVVGWPQRGHSRPTLCAPGRSLPQESRKNVPPSVPVGGPGSGTVGPFTRVLGRQQKPAPRRRPWPPRAQRQASRGLRTRPAEPRSSQWGSPAQAGGGSDPQAGRWAPRRWALQLPRQTHRGRGLALLAGGWRGS